MKVKEICSNGQLDSLECAEIKLSIPSLEVERLSML